MSTLSVVIPTYNGEEFIAEALHSILGQTRLPEEIIVVDDASTDRTVEIVRTVAQDAPVPIRLIERTVNSGGPAIPMNEGIEAARSKYIALLDQDDLMLPEKLARVLGVFETYPEADFVLTNYSRFDENRRILTENAFLLWPDARKIIENPGGISYIEAEKFAVVLAEYAGLPLSCSNQCFPKSLWTQVGGFSPKASVSSDFDFLVRGIIHGVCWIDHVLFSKRIHSKRAWKPTLTNCLFVLRARQTLARRYPHNKELRRIVAKWTRRFAQQLRWNHRYRESLAEGFRLFSFSDWTGALVECAKTCAAWPRDRLLGRPKPEEEILIM